MRVAVFGIAACVIVAPALAQEGQRQFPKRELGAVSGPAFSRVLTRSDAELRQALDGLRENEARYLAGERVGGFDMFDLQNALTTTRAALSGAQQLNSARSALQGGGRSGGRLDASSCATLQRYADQCKTSWENMRSVNSPSTKLGTTGQAGAFKDCYETYSKAYQQSCR